MAPVDLQIFGQFGTNPPGLLGRRILADQRTAVRDTAELLREIAKALDSEATFLEITNDLDVDD